MAIRSLKTGSLSRSTQAGNTMIFPGSYESIATVVVGVGGSASISFTSIPNTYQHLEIRAINTKTASASRARVRFNNDTTALNYYSHQLSGDGASATKNYESGSANGIWVGNNSNTLSTNGVEPLVIQILDYNSTVKNKTVLSLAGIDASGSGTILLASGFWASTAAITSITMSNDAVTTAQYSHFALYGVK